MNYKVSEAQEILLDEIRPLLLNTISDFTVDGLNLKITVAKNQIDVDPFEGDSIYFPDTTEKETRYLVTAVEVIESGFILTISTPQETITAETELSYISVSDELIAGANSSKYSSDRFPLVLVDSGKGILAQSTELAFLSYEFPFACFDATQKFARTRDCRNRTESILNALIRKLNYNVLENIEGFDGYFITGTLANGSFTTIEYK